MVKIIGRIHSASNELAYKVLAKGYAFEVTALGKRLRIKHLPGANGSKLPLDHLGRAFDEVNKFLGARCMALAFGS